LGLRSLVGIHVAELGDGVALDAPVLELHQRVLGAAVADLTNDLLVGSSQRMSYGSSQRMRYGMSSRYLRDLVLVAVLLGDVDMLGLRRGLVADIVVIELRVVHVKDVAVLVDDLVHEAVARCLGAVPVDDNSLQI